MKKRRKPKPVKDKFIKEAAAARAVLADVAPGESPLSDHADARSPMVAGAVDLGEVVVKGRVKSLPLCAVSGCGNDVHPYGSGPDRDRPATVCESCHHYATRKIAGQRIANGADPRSPWTHRCNMRDVLAALHVEFAERGQPTTGRGAAYRHGHGGSYGRTRNDG